MTAVPWPSPARAMGAHIRGPDRVVLRQDLARDYRAGASIRAVAAEHRLSYGTARTLLLEEGVRLRTRVGTRGGG
ncbi:hypothetical protein B0E38_04735 [Streptomyces sp. 111WW2]|uniref:helix-turn-helix domain-containing protein n=1 Tax=Streptomyces sp. 111WW2 TaxID=1945515 RepID=UPI000D0C80F8|nr:helix-turn-helix domain-containing protein [Streptomyces sp. 111WW2]PSK52409.1 hypothetical protein B0E38_04735 [Streptomyces sp. 111WW2]